MITHNIEEPPSKRSPINKFYKSLAGIIEELRENTRLTLLKLKVYLRSQNGKKFTINIVLLCFIGLIPWISEASSNKELYKDLSLHSDPIDPIMAGEFTESISKYTPGIDERKTDVSLSMMVAKNEYDLTKQLQLNVGIQSGEPERKGATYVMSNGETITQVAQKFDLHVASILDANSMSGTDTKKIKGGTELIIPSTDTSDSNDWLVAIKKAEDEEKKVQEIKRQKEITLKQAKLATASISRSLTTRERTASGYDGDYSGSLSTPISSRGISQYFGRGHTGVDYMSDVGTPVRSAAPGRIIKTSVGWSGGYGNQILVDHGGGRVTRYAHLSSINVDVGQSVGQGEVIGYSGNTGRSTGPHLHFELILGGSPVSPI